MKNEILKQIEKNWDGNKPFSKFMQGVFDQCINFSNEEVLEVLKSMDTIIVSELDVKPDIIRDYANKINQLLIEHLRFDKIRLDFINSNFSSGNIFDIMVKAIENLSYEQLLDVKNKLKLYNVDHETIKAIQIAISARIEHLKDKGYF